MPTVALRTHATVSNTFTIVGAASADAAMRDFSDATLLECPSTFVGEAVFLIDDPTVVPPGAVVRQFQALYRYEPQAPGFTTNPDTRIQIDGVWQAIQNPGATTTRVWGSTAAFVGAYSLAQIASLQVYIDGRVGLGGSNGVTRFFAIELDLLWALPPEVRATGPSGTLRINNPTVTWVHTPGPDATSGQTDYRVRVYDVANPAAPVWDSGNVASAAASAVVGPLPLAATYRAVVNTAQTTNGVQQWAPDSSVTFTLDVTGPTVDVTGPTGVLGTTSPTATWVHTPGAGAQTGQTHYRVRAFDKRDLVTPVYDSGPVASSAASAVFGPLSPDPALTWRVVVATAQTTYGALQWSPDDWTEFTIDVVPADVEAVTPTPRPELGAIDLLIERDVTSPPWLTIDVEATYDDGATWIPVRAATRLSVNGDTAHVTDHEAPNDRPVQYRARATRLSAGFYVTGAWVLSPVTSWHLAGDDVWIKDPDHPERNVKVCLSALPEAVYGRTVGVFRPVGAHYPVIVSDVLQSPSLTASVLTNTGAEADAFLAMVSAPVVLVQSPAVEWGWGSRYVAPGPVTETRTTPTSRKAVRIWAITMTEVARPADESAT